MKKSLILIICIVALGAGAAAVNAVLLQGPPPPPPNSFLLQDDKKREIYRNNSPSESKTVVITNLDTDGDDIMNIKVYNSDGKLQAPNDGVDLLPPDGGVNDSHTITLAPGQYVVAENEDHGGSNETGGNGTLSVS